MKKPLLFVFPIAVLATIAITTGSCDFIIIHYGSTSYEPVSPLQPNEGDGYETVHDFSFNIQDVKATTKQIALPSTGESSILIVPVQFQGSEEWTTTKLDIVNKAFFGEAGDTAWQSVSSFYKAASYGKLTISGEISPVFKMNVTAEEAAKHMSGDTHAPDEVVTKAFIADSDYYSLRKKYDKNGDGYVDSIVFVYSDHIDNTNGFWAWVYWNQDEAKNVNRPALNSYLWMSYDFFTNSKYAGYGAGIDAHTAIHETGHLLGLDDYYNYDENSKFDPSGALEMQSFNIGDQNIYSKFALGWVNPYYVKTESSVSLKLRSSALYGDAIIINDEWNKNSMDEYLILEYYTPEGMNWKDSVYTYKPNGSKANKMYTDYGFRIYHVDSRIAEVEIRGQFKQYVDTLGRGTYVVGASNSKSRSYLPKEFADEYKYLHLLEASGKNSFKTGNIASNATLFKKGVSFVASTEFFVNVDGETGESLFNAGNEVGYRIEITDCTSEYGAVTITKI